MVRGGEPQLRTRYHVVCTWPGIHEADTYVQYVQDILSEDNFMESKIRPVKYNPPWCVYVHRERAVH